MTHYSGSVPETRRGPDWRTKAACRDQDPETFFPSGYGIEAKRAIVDAKTVCLYCPTRDNCLNFALTEGIPNGVFGGLTEEERQETRRLKGDARTQYIETVRQPIDLAAVFAEHAEDLPDGHMQWNGGKTICYAGVYYTPRRMAFEIGRGSKPYGHVHTTCGRLDCVAPAHMEDQHERHMRLLTEKTAA
jgi:WhiB family redox-sensing transcriptional regulator